MFCNTRIYSTKEDAGFNKARTIGTGGTERFIRTRTLLQRLRRKIALGYDELPMDWHAYAQYIERHYIRQRLRLLSKHSRPRWATGANIGGLVVNGFFQS